VFPCAICFPDSLGGCNPNCLIFYFVPAFLFRVSPTSNRVCFVSRWYHRCLSACLLLASPLSFLTGPFLIPIYVLFSQLTWRFTANFIPSDFPSLVGFCPLMQRPHCSCLGHSAETTSCVFLSPFTFPCCAIPVSMKCPHPPQPLELLVGLGNSRPPPPSQLSGHQLLDEDYLITGTPLGACPLSFVTPFFFRFGSLRSPW